MMNIMRITKLFHHQKLTDKWQSLQMEIFKAQGFMTDVVLDHFILTSRADKDPVLFQAKLYITK